MNKRNRRKIEQMGRRVELKMYWKGRRGE